MTDPTPTLSVAIADHVATLTILRPPGGAEAIPLLTGAMLGELAAAGAALAADPEVRVVVVESADPDFFIAHADLALIRALRAGPPRPAGGPAPFQAMTETFRLMPKITIGKIRGIARGGGLEFLAALDMRFCAAGARFAQPEIGLGFPPGGGGMTRWPRLIGRARALELMAGADDLDAATAEAWGLVNRALPEAALDAHVARLARRIAGFEPGAIAALKKVVQAEGAIAEQLERGARAFDAAIRAPGVGPLIDDFMAGGGQTRTREKKPLIPDA